MIKLKKILFEKIIREGVNRPPGFSKLDVEPIQLPEKEEEVEQVLREFLPDDLAFRVVKDPEVWYKKQQSLGTGQHKQPDEPYIHPGNKEGDLDELISTITVQPIELLSQNRKIKKSGGKVYDFHNLSLPAYRAIFFDESDKKLKILNTCPMAEKCSKFCYAQKGGYIQFSRAQLALTRKLNFLFNHWNEFKSMLLSEIQKIDGRNTPKGIKTVIRWHDSGDFLSEKYLNLAFDIAKSTPNVLHYSYTKRVSMISKAQVPENFIFNFSFGGKEDDKIDTSKTRHADVITYSLYKPYTTKYRDESGDMKYKFNSKYARAKFMDTISKEFSLDRDSLTTYNRLMKTPVGKKKWNVIVGPGDGDDAGLRPDVIGIYLMEH